MNPSSNDNQAPSGSNAPQAPQPQIVYVSRPVTPHEPVISEEAKKRHEDSKAHYPNLNLSEGEYVISAIKRHPIGLYEIWGFIGFLSFMTLLFIPFYASNLSDFSRFLTGSASGAPSVISVAALLLLVCLIFALGGLAATKVYLGNKFFLTNESVIQMIQTSLLSKKEQTISLSNIEDASFTKHGILQHIFNYGSLRLSTEGDETTYRFNYVSDPRQQVTTLNNAVEAFKNGRPID